MKTLNYYEEQPKTRRLSLALVLNILTILVLLGVVCITSFFLLIFINPYTSFNPFPPPTMPVALALPTQTPTPRSILPPTWTPSPTREPTATFTPRPTATIPPTDTPFSVTTLTPGHATATVQATNTPGGMPFVIDGKIVAIENIAHPELGCNWMGVTGQVKDLRGSAIRGQQVLLGGAIGGKPIPGDFMLTLTGLAPQYGPGYYEFTITDKPLASKETLWIQLLDQAGLPMSDKIYFDTFNVCEKSLIIINFKQVR